MEGGPGRGNIKEQQLRMVTCAVSWIKTLDGQCVARNMDDVKNRV